MSSSNFKILPFDSMVGDTFPLDDGNVTEVTLKDETRLSLQCPALSGIPPKKATLIWSYGPEDAKSTTVIGIFNLPDGSKTEYSSKRNDCLSISPDGNLLLNNCVQDGDIRYWCHFFHPTGNMVRSYVLVKGKSQSLNNSTVWSSRIF